MYIDTGLTFTDEIKALLCSRPYSGRRHRQATYSVMEKIIVDSGQMKNEIREGMDGEQGKEEASGRRWFILS